MDWCYILQPQIASHVSAAHVIRRVPVRVMCHVLKPGFLVVRQAYEEQELLRMVYFGGVDPSLRREVWPFLLGHYQFGMSEAERKEVCLADVL